MISRVNYIRATAVIAFAFLYFVFMAPVARTYPPFLKQAKELGFPAKNCTYCHINAGGGDEWNARGKWLVEEKKKRKADEIDVGWLKEYKEAAKSESKPSSSSMKVPRKTKTRRA
ncbi:MAG: hypothetical protein ACRD63_13065 [Pyrinomonadaceae bacterium]